MGIRPMDCCASHIQISPLYFECEISLNWQSIKSLRLELYYNDIKSRIMSKNWQIFLHRIYPFLSHTFTITSAVLLTCFLELHLNSRSWKHGRWYYKRFCYKHLYYLHQWIFQRFALGTRIFKDVATKSFFLYKKNIL